MKIVRSALLSSAVIFLIIACSSCGGGGGGGGVSPILQYGEADGYIYVAVGSDRATRTADAAPAGYKPLVAASVRATCGTTVKITTTNSSGYFKLSSLPVGSCAVSMTKSGYGAKQINITVTAGSATHVGGSNGVTMSPSTAGTLVVRANVSGGQVVIDNEETNVVIPAGLTYTFTDISPGQHSISLVKSGFTSTTETATVQTNGSVEVTLIMNPIGNAAPVAVAGADKNCIIGAYYTAYFNGVYNEYTAHDRECILNGSASNDPNGDTLTYLWELVSGPAAEISNVGLSSTYFTPSTEGTYKFRITVSDGYLESEDVTTIEMIRIAGKITFTANLEQNHTGSEVYTMNADGTDLRRLTDNSYRDGWPHWSPDGNQILFTTNPSGDGETFIIAKMDEDGTNVISLSVEGISRDWSPDGEYLLYAQKHGGLYQLYEMDKNGSNPRKITTGYKKYFAYYSKDGSEILFNMEVSYDGNEIGLIDRDGSNYQQLTNNNQTHSFINWTYDGRILYTTASCVGCDGTLYVMNTNGTGSYAWPVPEGVTDINTFVMTDDGQFVFYQNADGKIHVMYSDGSDDLNFGISGSNIDYHPGP